MGMDGLSGQGQSPMNMGGSFNPAFSGGGASGQSNNGTFGIQPPRISNPYSVGSLGLSANRLSNPFQPSAQIYTPGADTSAEHQANVAMAQSGFGNIGLQGYRGFPGEVQGTSASSYGISPSGWADVNAYATNPLGQWQNPPGTGMGQYGAQSAMTNTDRYQMMIDTIKSSLSGQWPDMSWITQFPNATLAGYNPTQNAQGQWTSPEQPAWQGLTQLGNDYANTAVADLALRYGGGYGVLPASVTQNLGIPTNTAPGVRTYSA